MKKIAFFVMLILSLISHSFADSYGETFARFVEVAQLDKIFNSIIDEQFLAQSLEQQMAVMGVEFSKDMKIGLIKTIREVLQEAKPEYDKYIYEIYKKHYSQSELQELIAFYTTPIGKKVVKLQGELAKEGAIAGEKIMSKYQPLLFKKLQKVLGLE